MIPGHDQHLEPGEEPDYELLEELFEDSPDWRTAFVDWALDDHSVCDGFRTTTDYQTAFDDWLQERNEP